MASFAAVGHSGHSEGAPPDLDRDHLDRQTGGDRDLAAELLSLFAAQAGGLAGTITDAGADPRDRAEAAHRLKGSALAIGAMRLAAEAASHEDAARGEKPALPAETLREALAAVLAAASAAPDAGSSSAPLGSSQELF